MKLPALETAHSIDKDASLELTPTQEVAVGVVDRYAQMAPNERENFSEHARRTADLVHVFAGEDLPSKAIDAAYLHDLYDRATGDDPEKKKLAADGVMEYFNNPHLTNKQKEYVGALVNDMAVIEDTAMWYRENEGEYDYQEDDPEIWDKEAPPIPLDDMFTLSKTVNIESVLLKSCEMLDNLHNPAETNVAMMQDIHEAESFYAPLCEVLGYDGLAMELRSHAKQNRLMNQGGEVSDVMIEVAHFCHEMRELGPQSVLRHFADEDDYEISSVVNKPRYIDKYSETSYETVELGEFAIDAGDRLLTGNWRIKSVGSLMGKLLRKDRNGGMPMDVMGMTVISPDEEGVAKDFAYMARRTIESETLRPQKAPSKKHAFVVQGDRAYIDRMCAELGEEFVQNNVDIIENDKGYRVSKFTCLGEDDMPIEMQFVTKEDRKAGRVGKWAHIFHKLKESGISYSEARKAQYAEYLQEIHRRKEHMNAGADELVVNPHSLVYARREMQKLQKAHRVAV